MTGGNVFSDKFNKFMQNAVYFGLMMCIYALYCFNNGFLSTICGLMHYITGYETCTRGARARGLFWSARARPLGTI